MSNWGNRVDYRRGVSSIFKGTKGWKNRRRSYTSVILGPESLRGVLDISLGGEVRPGLFKTKSLIFLSCFKTEFRFLIPCLRHLTRNQKINCCSLVRRTYVQAVYRPRKDTLFKTKIPNTLAGRTSPWSPYKGVPPPPLPGAESINCLLLRLQNRGKRHQKGMRDRRVYS